ncbi:putative pentatricopeptide repeat-containing protein At3g15130 isoform X1 [Tripterygium wilfordii]|uniref:putative pentatricopeptide repeat-containing protein At3g15130 isoform X1 n=2 Tax=Tripterygium wilfordii TaxID=458696 RepID=UPI0018F7FFEC|nr:putative pentatricopeptide repeat-containing protein At3g15130 isoform X1 [Tripterygium wilfordii]
MNRLSFSLLSERQRYANLLRFCSRKMLIDQGVQVHGAVVRMGFGCDLMLSNDLVDMYGKCGKMDLACAVFDKMPDRNVVSWTALMCGFLQKGNPEVSLYFFCQMGSSGIRPNDFTLSTNLKACGVMRFGDIGMQIHGICVKTGFERTPVVGNAIMDMYSKCGRISEAVQMFDVIPLRNLICWNTMIAGYTATGYGEKAILLFREMQEHGEVPDEFTFTSTLKACSGLGAIREGNQIHAHLITTGFPCSVKTTITGALIDVLVKCGNLTEARKLFDRIEQKNVISWSSLILGYAQEENLGEAMNLFRQLRDSSIQIDGFVLSSMAGVFADFALVVQGRQMHAYAIKIPSGLDISVTNSIVDMYLKCGEIDEAKKLFCEMPFRNVVSWTVMITGYGKHGLGKEAVNLFKEMQLDNIKPDDVTYLAILSACSHSGLVDESQEYFLSLIHDRQIKPRVEHYACMVDLLGRAGRLNEAKKLIDSMPLKPNIGIWQTLLSACRLHGDLEMGREVGEILLRLDGCNPVNYVMMSNMYAEAGYWKDCERVRELVKTKGLKKEAGRSWVEIDKKVHFFYGGDDTHPLTVKIHEVLKEMERRMKEEIGYIRRLKYALHDVEEESKEESLRVHSEKLAIGLALVCGGFDGRGGVIRIFKNLRVCGDCHDFIKGLSEILKLVFVVRDANRFHRFEDGLCSCGDYW